MPSRSAARLAELLSMRGAVLRGEFLLASGRKSNVYVDARLLLGDPGVFREALSLLAEAAPGGEYSVLGVATAGIPWATGLSLRLGKPLGYVRVERKGHGRDRLVEGSPPRGPVVLVDDVATTGGSLAAAVEAARSEGYEPLAALVLVDRGEGARERLSKLGVELRSVASLGEILDALR